MKKWRRSEEHQGIDIFLAAVFEILMSKMTFPSTWPHATHWSSTTSSAVSMYQWEPSKEKFTRIACTWLHVQPLAGISRFSVTLPRGNDRSMSSKLKSFKKSTEPSAVYWRRAKRRELRSFLTTKKLSGRTTLTSLTTTYGISLPKWCCETCSILQA